MNLLYVYSFVFILVQKYKWKAAVNTTFNVHFFPDKLFNLRSYIYDVIFFFASKESIA